MAAYVGRARGQSVNRDKKELVLERIARMFLWALFPVLLLAGVSACTRSASPVGGGDAEASATVPADGTAERPGSMLAYEHRINVVLPEDAIIGRLRATQAACTGARFGRCEVLTVDQSGGDAPRATLTVRIVPAGVEPMIALAGEGGRIGARNTRAEDLAQAVNDNARQRARLQKELALLQEFQQRKDLAVADMVALSQRISDTESQLESAEQEGAQQQRRITTQLLTIGFGPTGSDSGLGEIGSAVRDSGELFAQGVAWMIRAVAFLLPLALGLFVLVAIVRRLRRRKSAGKPQG